MGSLVPLVCSLNYCPSRVPPWARQLDTSAHFDAANESTKRGRGCQGELSTAGAISRRAAGFSRGSSGWLGFRVVEFQSGNEQALRLNSGPIANGIGRSLSLSTVTRASNDEPKWLDNEDALQRSKVSIKELEWLDYEDAAPEDSAMTPEFLDVLSSDLAPSQSASSFLKDSNEAKSGFGLPPLLGDLGILDACEMCSDLTQVGKAYDWLLSKGLLTNFGKEKARVCEGERVLITEALLKSSIGLNASKLSPKKWGFSGMPAIALPIGIALFSYIRDSGVDVRPIGAFILALGFYDALKLGGTGLLQIRSMWLPYKRRVLVHEAGHVLVAYLLGCPIRGVILDPIQAAKIGVQGQGGTQFWDQTIDMEFSQSVMPSSTVDRYSIVLFAGVAAEALIYGEAQGGETDENLFKAAVSQLQPSWSPAQMSDQARWAVLQAFQLLECHKKAHAAVIEALDQGCGLGSLIRTIEEAIP